MKIVDINYYLYNQSFRVPITTPKVHLTSRKALIIEMITSQGKSFLVNAMHLNRIGMTQKQLIVFKRLLKHGRVVSKIKNFRPLMLGSLI